VWARRHLRARCPGFATSTANSSGQGVHSRPAGSIVVLDEIHRLTNPSEVLKIAADHFPKVRVVATGSSTLAARRKFKDMPQRDQRAPLDYAPTSSRRATHLATQIG
jgi:hypothetical protein